MHIALLTPCPLLYPPNHFCLPTTSSLPSPRRPGGVVGAMPPSRLGWQIFRTVSRGGDNPFPAEGGRLPTPLWPAASLSLLPWRGMCVARESSTAEVPWQRPPLFPPLCCHGDSGPLPISSCCRGDGEDEPRWRLRSPRQHAPLRCHGSGPLASSNSAPLLWQQPRSSSLCPVATATAPFPLHPKKAAAGQSPTCGQGREGLGG